MLKCGKLCAVCFCETAKCQRLARPLVAMDSLPLTTLTPLDCQHVNLSPWSPDSLKFILRCEKVDIVVWRSRNLFLGETCSCFQFAHAANFLTLIEHPVKVARAWSFFLFRPSLCLKTKQSTFRWASVWKSKKTLIKLFKAVEPTKVDEWFLKFAFRALNVDKWRNDGKATNFRMIEDWQQGKWQNKWEYQSVAHMFCQTRPHYFPSLAENSAADFCGRLRRILWDCHMENNFPRWGENVWSGRTSNVLKRQQPHFQRYFPTLKSSLLLIADHEWSSDTHGNLTWFPEMKKVVANRIMS